jgi:hypothetical protein
MDPHYLDDFLDDDYINDWDYQHSPSRAPVGGPVCQRPGDPIVIPGYTLDDQGIWQPPDEQFSSPTDLLTESVDDMISKKEKRVLPHVPHRGHGIAGGAVTHAPLASLTC